MYMFANLIQIERFGDKQITQIVDVHIYKQETRRFSNSESDALCS